MKKIRSIVIAAIMVMALPLLLFSQEAYKQEFTIPLTHPGQAGKLKVDLHDGAVTVEGHSGKEVLITVVSRPDDDDEPETTREGLRRIPNTASDFKISENDNVVNIDGGHNGRSDFTVKVPSRFSLILHTHHNGDIKVSNVTGDIEADGHHGGIHLDQVGGSVIADTHHGEIVVTFTSVEAGKPMAFSTYHGDVDVTFPGNTGASVKVKSTKGDIYTDFDMEMKVEQPETTAGENGGTRIKLGGWLYGDLGNGGPEFMFNTYHGDVIIRKK